MGDYCRNNDIFMGDYYMNNDIFTGDIFVSVSVFLLLVKEKNKFLRILCLMRVIICSRVSNNPMEVKGRWY